MLMDVPSQLLLCEIIAKHLVEGPGHCEPAGPAVLKRRTEERAARTNQNLLASLCLSLPPLALMASEHKFLFRPTRGERILGNKVPANLISMSHHRGMTQPFAETRRPGGAGAALVQLCMSLTAQGPLATGSTKAEPLILA